MEKFTTPKAPCLYPFLQQPNVSKTGEYEDTFQITLVLDPQDKEHHELLKHIKRLHEESKGKEEKKPIKKHTDLEGNETGKYMVRFKTKAQYLDHVPTFDAKGNKILRDKNFVANDSIVRVSWSYGFYKQGGGGVSLYLNGVQIIDLIEWSGGDAEDYGFDETEGYEEYQKMSKDEIEDFKKEIEAEETNDDLPF